MRLKSALLAAAAAYFTVNSHATVFVDVSTLGEGIVDTIGGATAERSSATVLTRDQRWTRDRVYVISQNTFISNGVTLRIEPGTLVRFEKHARDSATAGGNSADPGTLIVARGGTLIAAGTADAPIIFTSIDDPHVPGGENTIPPYLNYADRTNANSTIQAAYKQLRSGFTTVRGTPGVGEYEITGGTFQNLGNYDKAVHASSLWSQTGQWGGIVWLGQANIAGQGTATGDLNSRTRAADNLSGLYPAEGMAEYSTFARGGGDNDSDDQGLVRFLSNRYGGFVISGNSELNAFSFYGAGYNTVVEFIEDFNNKDDSFEFWGGCNTIKYAVSAFCGDDGFDTDAGWVGNAQFLVQIQNPKDNASGVQTTARLNVDCGDNLSENDGPEPTKAYRPLGVLTLANATFIGRGYGDTGIRPTNNPGVFQGPNFKSAAANKWYNNIVMDAPWGALAISGSDANNFFLSSTIEANKGYDGSGYNVLGQTDTNTPTEPYAVMKGTVFYRCGLAYDESTGSSTVPATNINTGAQATFAQLFRSNNYARETGSGANHNRLATIQQIFGGDVETVISNSITAGTHAALSNNNYVNLDPGFTVPTLTRITTNSISLIPTNSIVRDSGAVTIDKSKAPQLDQLTEAPFIGAARDNAWWMGWTMISQTGIFKDSETAIAPNTVALSANGSNPKLSFTAAANVKYSVERSTDGKLFRSIGVVSTNGTGLMEYTDSGATVGTNAVTYRVLAL